MQPFLVEEVGVFEGRVGSGEEWWPAEQDAGSGGVLGGGGRGDGGDGGEVVELGVWFWGEGFEARGCCCVGSW